MANWNTYVNEAAQAERTAVFNKIAPKPNWKAAIDAWIEIADFAECNEAAIYFTGGSLNAVEAKGTKVRVQSAGYYVNIGA